MRTFHLKLFHHKLIKPTFSPYLLLYIRSFVFSLAIAVHSKFFIHLLSVSSFFLGSNYNYLGSKSLFFFATFKLKWVRLSKGTRIPVQYETCTSQQRDLYRQTIVFLIVSLVSRSSRTDTDRGAWGKFVFCCCFWAQWAALHFLSDVHHSFCIDKGHSIDLQHNQRTATTGRTSGMRKPRRSRLFNISNKTTWATRISDHFCKRIRSKRS